MYPSDSEKTAFITDSANYCYKVMSFWVEECWSTYKRLMNKIFRDHIGRNVEVYVDDMVVKSDNLKQHLSDLTKLFS